MRQALQALFGKLPVDDSVRARRPRLHFPVSLLGFLHEEAPPVCGDDDGDDEETFSILGEPMDRVNR